MSVGILAIAAGLVGAYGVRSMLVKETPVTEEEEIVALPLASADLPAGRVVEMGDIGLVNMTRPQMVERGMNISITLTDPAQFIGRTLKEPVKQGDPFLTTGLYLQGQGPDVTGRLKPGFRAMNIYLDRGAVVPAQDDRVDVVFRSTPRRGDRGTLSIPEVTKTILHGVEVLAVDRPREAEVGLTSGGGLDLRRLNVPSQGPPPTTVTLAVNLDQANILQTVQGRGTLSLVVRSRTESLGIPIEDEEVYSLETLLGIKPPPAPPTPVLFRTDIYRAGQRRSTVFVGGVVQSESGDEDEDAEPGAVPDSDDAEPLLPPGDEEDAADEG